MDDQYQYLLTVTDPVREEEFQQIFGSTTVCIESPSPVEILFEGRDALVYFLDLNVLNFQQTDKLIAHISFKFNVPVGVVASQIIERGVPIMAQRTIVEKKVRL
jgi:hypothetical protein